MHSNSSNSEIIGDGYLDCAGFSLMPFLVVHFSFYLFIYLSIYLFIYLWLCWVFVSVRGLSPVAAGGGHPSSWCAGLTIVASCCGAQAPDAQAQ